MAVHAEIEYTNGTFKYMVFDTKQDARDFINNDGDHVVDYSIWSVS